MMKIAVITDDGKTISRHFGRAPYYLVLTIEDQRVTQRELREKLGHRQFAAQNNAHEDHDHTNRGLEPSSHNKHVNMAAAISDCQALICGGMGMGAYQSMQMLNIKPIITELEDIDEAVTAYLEGKLVDRTEMLH
jgi:predicted Fe-Mo cluster-binding NifX family protein